jgi:hypothetical protein
MATRAANIIVFGGPTLFGARALPAGLALRGPAGKGDVYRATLEGPRAIAIIDGYFDQTPSVWHKEIIYALASGTPVIGAASMGALRAVELAACGMRGVGRVYEMFATGVLEDDDEVAVAHASSADGHRPLSNAMVDIRASMEAAEADGLVTPDLRVALVAGSKALHFSERSLALLPAMARDAGAEAPRVEALREWISERAVHLKRLDAMDLLDALSNPDSALLAPLEARPLFERTRAWEALRSRIDNEIALAARSTGQSAATGTAMEISVASWRGALLRAAASEEAEQRRTRIDQAALDKFVEDFRRERDLLSTDAFEAWLSANDLDSDDAVVAFFESEILVRSLCTRISSRARGLVPTELRGSGLYGARRPRTDLTRPPD